MADEVTTKFTSSLQHILAELQRLDLLLRVQVWRLRQARDHEVNLSSFYIPEEEVDDILGSDVGTPLWAALPLPPEMLKDVQAQLVFQTAVIAQQKAATTIPLRLDQLAAKFQLTQLDLDILLIALAPEIDLRYARLYSYLQDNVTHRLPTVNLCLSLLFPYIEDRLAAHSRLTSAAPLRQHGLLHLVHDPANPHPSWLDDGLTLDNRIVRYLLDGDEPDGRLSDYVEIKTPTIDMDSLLLPPDFAPRLTSLARQHANLIFYFEGVYGVGKQTTANAICRELERSLLVVNGEHLLKQAKDEQFAQIVNLIDREARLQETAVFWEKFDLLLTKENAARQHLVLTMLAQRPGLTILSGSGTWESASFAGQAPFVRVAFPVPDYDERAQLWQTMLGEETADAAVLANKFRFSPGQIHDSVETARNLARWRNPEHPQVETADLYAAGRLHSNRKLA
ncbi:MAG: AAA family ATPase, partial [Anaerolineales bacterium]|nr:AAA family ATPase [Anaerolineales bacterium]